MLKLIQKFFFPFGFMFFADDPNAGGGAGAGQGDGGKSGAGDGGQKTDPAKELEALKAQNAELAKKLAALEENGKSLLDKTKRDREQGDQDASRMKAMENALRFSLASPEWLKTNQSLLPKEIADLFKTAEKEKYDTAIEKASALKSGIVQSFFSVQANVDLLTPGLKDELDDYLKLTQTGKQEKASKIYDTVFEPAFEMLKRVKKAEVLNKGYSDEGDFEVSYKNKMMKLSKEAYLGGKQ